MIQSLGILLYSHCMEILHIYSDRECCLQRATLELLAKRRYEGCIRTDLTRIMASDANKFHYVLNVCSPMAHQTMFFQSGKSWAALSLGVFTQKHIS